MRLQAFKARPRRRRLPPDLGERQAGAVAPNVLGRSFEAAAPNRKWIADFTYVWTAEGWLFVAAVIDLFSRRVVGWSMSAGMGIRQMNPRWSTANGAKANHCCSGVWSTAMGLPVRGVCGGRVRCVGIDRRGHGRSD